MNRREEAALIKGVAAAFRADFGKTRPEGGPIILDDSKGTRSQDQWRDLHAERLEHATDGAHSAIIARIPLRLGEEELALARLRGKACRGSLEWRDDAIAHMVGSIRHDHSLTTVKACNTISTSE